MERQGVCTTTHSRIRRYRITGWALEKRKYTASYTASLSADSWFDSNPADQFVTVRET